MVRFECAGSSAVGRNVPVDALDVKKVVRGMVVGAVKVVALWKKCFWSGSSRS